MRFRIEYLLESTDELSVCHTLASQSQTVELAAI